LHEASQSGAEISSRIAKTLIVFFIKLSLINKRSSLS